MNIRCAFLLVCVGLFPVSVGAQGVVSPEAEARESLVRSSLLLAEVGSRLGEVAIEDAAIESSRLWQETSDDGLREMFGLEEDEEGVLVRLGWLEERLSTLRDAFPEVTADKVASRREPSWPVAACPLPNDAGSTVSWDALSKAVILTEGAMDTLLSATHSCTKIKIETIDKTEGFHFDDLEDEFATTCRGEISFDLIGCEFEMEGVTRGAGVKVRGGEGIPHPAADAGCASAALVLKGLAATQESLGMMLECWDFGTAKANYERLGVIHEEIEGMQKMADAIRRLLFEHALSVRGGSRPAIAYLPAEHGGYLEETVRVAETAIESTSALGYRMRPGVTKYMIQGDEEKAEGDIKRAFDRYRKAFRLATRASLEKAETLRAKVTEE